jgi:GNAT superfamily N-acetyltransferase
MTPSNATRPPVDHRIGDTDILIEAIGPDRLAEYAGIPMVIDVRSILTIDEINGGLGGLALAERPVRAPYTKNYDADSDGGPLQWPKRFDISNWGLWIVHQGAAPIGGAAVAWNTPGLDMLEGRSDLAVLWDIRVQESSRLRGIGRALFRQAAQWARAKGCTLLKIETQNVNVSACRFYAKMGCSLGSIDRFAYRQQPEIAGEVRLIWYLNLLD